MTPTALLTILHPTLHLPLFTTRVLAVLTLCAEAGDKIDFGAVNMNLRFGKSALSHIIDLLEGRKLIERSRDFTSAGADCRKVFITITQEGRDFLGQMGVA